jgi:hypothetical protein
LLSFAVLRLEDGARALAWTRLNIELARPALPGCWHGGSTAFSVRLEQGEIGPDLFRHACLMGWKAWSLHRENSYRSGRFRHWIKVKNRQHPVFSRVQTSSRNDRGRRLA